jgi:pimeloyl-ACP methyl ester carboxylesterase
LAGEAGVSRRQGFVNVGGTAIHYVAVEPEGSTRTPVLVVPGFGEAADEWEAFSQSLDRPAVSVSVRGRGLSDAPATGYRWEDHIDDLEAVVNEMGWDQFAIAAYSRGSSYALGLALRFPERTKSLVIADYTARHVGLPPEFVEMTIKRKWNGRPMSERMPRHAVEGLQVDAVEIPLWDRLRELKCPLLLVRPERPAFLNDETVAQWEASYDNLEIALLPGTSHNLWLEDPAAFQAVVREFLDRTAD